jgi:hypothetical protein
VSTSQNIFKIICLYLIITSNSFATSIRFGDILISEVMANPSAVSDGNGEWFEIFNASVNTIALNGLTINDDGSNSHTINAGASLFIAPGEYFVLGNNGDTMSNGGYIANYVYSGFSLANGSDQIILQDNNSEIARLEYTGSPFGVSGSSVELINQVINPGQSEYGVTPNELSFQYGEGDFGTPGTSGSLILSANAPVPIPGAIWLFGSALLFSIRRLAVPTTSFKPTIGLSNRTEKTE